MSEKPQWMLYGANGYTGRLIAAAAVARGMQPVLAGRNRAAIEPLAASFGCQPRVFPLGDLRFVAQQLAGMSALLNCAGPFSATARAAIDACLAAGVHYLDITGEIDVILEAAARGDRARQAGISLLPAVGFDVVPSDCLAAMLAERLPAATRLELAFAASGSASRGTMATALEVVSRGGRARIDGRVQRVPLAWKTRLVPFASGERLDVTIPWGDVASAWFSTGIPNIETYMATTPSAVRLLRWLRIARPLLRWAPLRRWLERRITGGVGGPDERELREGRASLWGRVSDAGGRSVEATLEVPNGYTCTVLCALASVEKVLAGETAAGFFTPSQAFGPRFILSIPDVEFQWRIVEHSGS